MNNSMQWFVQALKTELTHLPILMVSLAAVVLAIVKWRQAPLAAVFCLLGFGVIFCLSAGMPLVQYFFLLGPGRSSPASVGVMMTILGVIWSVLVAVAYVLLALAIFAGRAKPPQG